MSTKRVNGTLFADMVAAGLKNLQAHEIELNRQNVFPVADGDTGTNMRITLEKGLRAAPRGEAAESIRDFLKGLSSGMLMGARGNSGVILAQLFKGYYLELSRSDRVSPGTFVNALTRGYMVAYEAVINPVEGTILTVARLGVERLKPLLPRNADFEALLTLYIAQMRQVLVETPTMLQVLRDMHVVDSGGTGLIYIFEGMLACLCGEMLPDVPDAARLPAAPPAPDFSKFDENSRFEDGYCMEFILQRLRRDYRQDFSRDALVAQLQTMGESIVCVEDETRVKVHIHTKKPADIINLVQQYGEFLTFKLENMQLQHNEVIAGAAAQTGQDTSGAHLTVIASACGEAAALMLREMGCDAVLDSRSQAGQLHSAIRAAGDGPVLVLPGSPQLLTEALQARKSDATGRIRVVPSASVAEVYWALAMDLPDSPDPEERITAMQEALEGTEALRVVTSGGSSVAFRKGTPAAEAATPLEAVLAGLRSIPDIGDRETCIAFRAARIPEADEQALLEAVGKAWPMLECTVMDGGDEPADWSLAVI